MCLKNPPSPNAKPPSVQKKLPPPPVPKAKRTPRPRNGPSPPICSSPKTGVSVSRQRTPAPVSARSASSLAQSGRSSTTKRKSLISNKLLKIKHAQKRKRLRTTVAKRPPQVTVTRMKTRTTSDSP